eukprot:11178417-Lingulodinium_polyedra.AAC.1
MIGMTPSPRILEPAPEPCLLESALSSAVVCLAASYCRPTPSRCTPRPRSRANVNGAQQTVNTGARDKAK